MGKPIPYIGRKTPCRGGFAAKIALLTRSEHTGRCALLRIQKIISLQEISPVVSLIKNCALANRCAYWCGDLHRRNCQGADRDSFAIVCAGFE